MKPFYIAGIFLFSIFLVVTIVVYPRLPETVPTHWNIHGEIDGTGSRNTIFLLPGITAFLLVMWQVLPWLSPKHFSVDSFRRTYDYCMFLVVALFCYLHTIILCMTLNPSMKLNRFLMAGLFLFFALIGNVMGKVQRNFWIGVRTPWTLANERVWNDTHRFAARIFVGTGIIGFVASLAGLHPAFAIILMIAAALTSVGYSLFDYKRLQKRGEIL